MASKKPRNKAYRARDIKIPPLFQVLMIGDEEPDLAHQIYAAIYTFLHVPTITYANNLGLLVTTMAEAFDLKHGGRGIGSRQEPGCVAVVSAVRAMMDIAARYDKYGVVTVRETEAMTLRAAAGRLDEALRCIPVTLWNEACVKVKLDEAKIHEFLRKYQREELREAA